MRLRYAEYQPSPQLSPLVECFWLLEGESRGRPEPVVPDGRMEIIFHYGSPFRYHHASGVVELQSAAIVAGQTTAPVILSQTGTAGVAAVRLRPAAAAAVLRMRADTLTGDLRPLDDVMAAASVSEKLVETPTDAAKVVVLENWLRGLHTREPRVDVSAATQMILASGGTATIESLTAHCRLSRRQLERVFLEHVGLPPKVFARVIRLRRALKLLRRGFELSHVSAICGYYDQAHMSLDFRQLADRTPSAWRHCDGDLDRLFAD